MQAASKLTDMKPHLKWNLQNPTTKSSSKFDRNVHISLYASRQRRMKLDGHIANVLNNSKPSKI